MTQPLSPGDALNWLPDIAFMDAREAGVTWGQIATKLGVTEEQARQRAGLP